MNFNNFLDFNSKCPICGEHLTLYLQMIDSMCFKGITIFNAKNKVYSFEPFKSEDPDFAGSYIDIEFGDSKIDIRFSSQSLKQKALQKQIYLFYLCNDKGFIGKNWYIDLYRGCYYRCSPIFDLYMDDKNVIITNHLSRTNSKIVNTNEAFSLSRKVNDVEKIYMVNIDYENEETVLLYYTRTDKEAKDKKFRPKIFEKVLPKLNIRPNFDIQYRDKLFSRLDNWVLMS